MQVAIAGMEYIGHAQASGRRKALDFVQQQRQYGTWNYAVLHDVVGRDMTHGGEGSFAPLPDQGAFLLRLGNAILRGAIVTA